MHPLTLKPRTYTTTTSTTPEQNSMPEHEMPVLTFIHTYIIVYLSTYLPRTALAQGTGQWP